jgi:putative transposase
MPIKSYKYRLYPNKATAEKLQWTLDRCRELYNAALQERKEAWKYEKKSISRYDQQNDLPEIKRDIRPEYQEIGAHVLQDVVGRVDKAFKAFFRRVKNGEKAGYPRYQGRNRYDSFTYPDIAGWKLEERTLHLSKIGNIRVKLHREVQGAIKACTIKREGEQWHVFFVCEIEVQTKLPYTDLAIGVDLGVSKLATFSDGDVIENPKHYRKAEKKLAKLQQSLSRKKKGSHRRKKAVKAVAQAHRKIRRQRADYLHKHSRWLVDCYEVIVFEDIKPANLSKRAKPKQDEATGQYLLNGGSAKSGLNKSILDAGWSQFITYCQYKAVEAGTVKIVLVDPKYTSQVCSGCGAVVKKTLEERWHECLCGCSLDRDHNAARNILKLGLQQLWIQHLSGRVGPTLTTA